MSSSAHHNASPGPSSRPSGSANPGGSAAPRTGEKRSAHQRDSPTPIPPPPKNPTGTNAAGFLHGYILFGLTRADVGPPLPTAATLAAFERRSDVGASRLVADIRKKALEDEKKGSNTAKNILQVEDAFLTIIFSKLLAFGLEAWRPDLMSPVDSLYNETHQIVYFTSFRAIAAFGGYYSLAPSMSGIKNNQLIFDIYRSFAFSYMKHKAKIEMRSPGKLLEDKDDNNSSRRRKRIAKKRTTFATAEKLPDRVVSMVSDPCCNSDDESGTDDEGKKVYVVNAKTIRSLSATTFIHKLEDRRTKTDRCVKGKKKSNIHERTRVRIDNPEESDLSFQMPKKAPVDYFAPTEFNDFPVQMRFKYGQYGVALPLLEHHDKSDWKTMDKETFMSNYGNDVLKQYNIPTPEEMAQKSNDGWDSEEEPIAVPQDIGEDDGMDQTVFINGWGIF